MDKKTFALNIVYAVFDTLIGVCGVGVFGLLAWHCDKWWIALFALVPLSLYNNHTLIIDADLQQKGGDSDT